MLQPGRGHAGSAYWKSLTHARGAKLATAATSKLAPDPNRRRTDRLQRESTGLITWPMVLRWSCAALVLFLASPRATAACIDPSTFAHSTVSITRMFDDQEAAVSDILGIRGTGWFLTARSLATVAHVAEAMHLSRLDWKDITIRDGETTQAISVRIVRLIGTRLEKIALLELQRPFPDAQFLQIRVSPLAPDEPVVSFGYRDDRRRFVSGRFVQYGTDDEFAGMALLELYDGTDRLAIDHGASGAPVLDCEGRVVAVVSNVLTQTIGLLSRVIRVSTAWQRPNVVAVPIQTVEDFDQPISTAPPGRIARPPTSAAN